MILVRQGEGDPIDADPETATLDHAPVYSHACSRERQDRRHRLKTPSTARRRRLLAAKDETAIVDAPLLLTSGAAREPRAIFTPSLR